MDLSIRPRRLRGNESIRKLCRETRLSPDSLIYPIFVDETLTGTRPIPSLEGQLHYGLDSVGQAVEDCLAHRGGPVHPLWPAGAQGRHGLLRLG